MFGSSNRLTLLLLTLTWAFFCLWTNNPAQPFDSAQATAINIFKHRYVLERWVEEEKEKEGALSFNEALTKIHRLY